MEQNVIISIQYVFIQENYFSKSGCQVQGISKNETSSFWAALLTAVSPGLRLSRNYYQLSKYLLNESMNTLELQQKFI